MRERSDVTRRLPAHAVEQGVTAQTCDHRRCRSYIEWRDDVDHVVDDFGERATKPQRHHRTKYLVVDNADDDLQPIVDHFTGEYPFDGDRRCGTLDIGEHLINSVFAFGGVTQIQPDAAGV